MGLFDTDTVYSKKIEGVCGYWEIWGQGLTLKMSSVSCQTVQLGDHKEPHAISPSCVASWFIPWKIRWW